MIKNKDAYMKPFTFVVNNNMSKQVDRTFGDRVSSREVLEKNKIKYTIPYDGDLEWFINRYNIKGQLVEKIVKKSDGYYVQSEEGKNLGGPYKKKEDAEKRLDQVEYFKNKNKKIDEEDTSKQTTRNKKLKRDIVRLAKQNGFEGIVNTKELTVHHIDDSKNEDGLKDNSYKNLWFIKSKNWKDRELLHKVLHFMDRNNVSYDALLNRLEDIKLYQYDEATNSFKEKTLSVFKESLKHNKRGMNEDMTNENKAGKRYYVVTHSKDRVGNKNRRYRVVDASSKADVKRKLNGGFYGTIDAIFTKEEALSKFGEDNFKKLWNINLVDESLTEDIDSNFGSNYELTRSDIFGKFKRKVDEFYKHAFEVGTDEAWERFYKDVDKMAAFYNKKIEEHNKEFRNSPNNIRIANEWDLIDPKYFLSHYDMMGESLKESKDKMYRTAKIDGRGLQRNHEYVCTKNGWIGTFKWKINRGTDDRPEPDCYAFIGSRSAIYLTPDEVERYMIPKGRTDEWYEWFKDTYGIDLIGSWRRDLSFDWLEQDRREKARTLDPDTYVSLYGKEWADRYGVFDDKHPTDDESLDEGAEGKIEPGFEYIIYDYTDEDGPNPIVAKRSTRTEAEYTAMRWMGNDYITNGRSHPKYADRYLTFERVPKGKFKVGDDFYGPFDADYNKLESLKENNEEEIRKLRGRLLQLNKAVEQGEDPERFAWEKEKIFNRLDELGADYYVESLTEDIGGTVTKQDVQFLKDWVKRRKFGTYGIDEENGKAFIIFEASWTPESFEELVSSFSEGSISKALKDRGFNIEFSRGDYTYKTQGTFNPRSMVRYSGNDRTLRNRFRMDISWNPITNESLTEDIDSNFGGDLTYTRDEELLSKFDKLYTECENELNSKLNITLEGNPFGKYNRTWKTAIIPVDNRRTIKVSLGYMLPDGIYNYIVIIWSAELETKSGSGNLYGINYSSSSRYEKIGSGYYSAYKDGSEEEEKGMTIDEFVGTIKTKYLNESLTEDTLKLSGKMKTIDVMPSFERWLEDHGQDPEAVKGNKRLYDFYRKKYEKEDRELVKSNNESVSEGYESLTEKVSPEGYAPKQTGKAYKVFRVKNGKLYPPMVANAGGADTPIGVWLDAEEGEFAGLSKTGRPQVKSTGSGNLAYRPGWHLGDVPRAPQFDRRNKETGEMEFPADFVWAECDYAMDIDYQPEADERGYMRTKVDDKGNVSSYRSDKYQHSLAGLPKLPTNGYYKYRTNPRPDTVPWVITGQMKVNRLLSDDEVNEILRKNGVEPIHRQGGDKTLKELGLKEGLKESLLKEDTQIWKSDTVTDYAYDTDIDELKAELDDMEVDYEGWDENQIRNYFIDDDMLGETEYEDFKYNLLPAIDNQCFGDVLVLFGDAANWRGTRAATKVLHKADDLEKYIYPDYDATTTIYEDDKGIYYTQSTHDTPMGGTKMYLYSLKGETDLDELDKWCSESEWFDPEYDYSVDFLENNTDYKDIKDLIDKGILTPIKNIV